MRHTEKVKQKWEAWNAIGCTFDATVYRARLDSPQVTVVVEQYNDDFTINKRWRKSFRADSASEADAMAEDYIEYVKRGTLEAQEIEAQVESYKGFRGVTC